MPTKDEMRALLNLAAPAEEDPIDLGLEMLPPRISNGVLIPTRPKPSLRNLDSILRGDPMFAGTIRYNELKQAVQWHGRSLQDHDVTELRLAIVERHSVEFTGVQMQDMLPLVARDHRHHPVREWLLTLEWDGVPRLDTWLPRWGQVVDTPLHRAYGRKTCIGAVRRVMEPGCKMDTVLVLHGGHGKGKSSMCRVMAHEEGWFNDTKIDWDSKEKYVALQGVWLYELAELAGKRKAEQETVKNYISSATDKYRPPYGRHMVEVPRSCVFIATTNEDEPLHDPTGNRRWWVVSVDAVDTELVKAEYEQVWAEAMEAWRQGEQHWLEPELEQQREDIQVTLAEIGQHEAECRRLLGRAARPRR
jgi:predicted P-loop ATPase